MSSSQTFSIAPQASTVNIHIYQNTPDNQAVQNITSFDSRQIPLSTRFNSLRNPIVNQNQPVERQIHSENNEESTNETVSSPSQENTSNTQSQNARDTFSDILRIIQIPRNRTQHIHRPISSSTNTPPVFQRVQTQSTSLQDMLRRIRRQGQTDEYTVSFELGNTEESTPNNGLNLMDLGRHTTTGLYSDINASDEENNESKENDDQLSETCSICQEALLPQSIIRQIDRCSHLFHQECIEKWLSEHNTCPLCMQPVAENEENNHTLPANTEDTNINEAHERLFNAVAFELGI